MSDQSENLPQQTAPIIEPEIKPLAMIAGEPMNELPLDLYIPPDALQVFLDAFQGPLDLLLYLIKRHNLDILDIPIAEVTRQYIAYVELMKDLHLELAAEYLVMAAALAEIKSRMLLPRSDNGVEEEEDPRAELVRRLQEYEQYKQAAEDIDSLPRFGRDVFTAKARTPDWDVERAQPELSLPELLSALKDVMARAEMFSSHSIEREPLSVRERMSSVLARLQAEPGNFTEFTALFEPSEGRMGVVVTLLAILELVKEAMLELVQAGTFGPIHVRAV